jgi:hypothetical protein
MKKILSQFYAAHTSDKDARDIDLSNPYVSRAKALNDNLDTLFVVREDVVETDNDAVEVVYTVVYQSASKVAIDFVRGKPTTTEPSGTLKKSHIGFNYYRWDGHGNFAKYGNIGLNRMLCEAINLWDEQGNLINEAEWIASIKATKAYPCLNWIPKGEGATHDEQWSNDPTKGTTKADYSRMAALVKKAAIMFAPHTEYIELENETNRWWKGEIERYTAQEFAALQSAMYDAVKSVTNLKVVMTGLAYFDEPYMLEAKQWWVENNNGLMPFDVIAAHHYCNKGNKEMKVEVTEAWSPEDDNFAARAKRWTTFCKKEFGNKPCWLGEFGYAVNESDAFQWTGFSQSAPDAKTGAKWTIDQARIAIENGFDKVQIFEFQDHPTSHTYSRCGHHFANEDPAPRTVKEYGKEFFKLYDKLTE